MKKLFKLLSTIVSLILVFTLIGCNSSGNGSSNANSTSTETSDKEGETTKEEKEEEDEPKEITEADLEDLAPVYLYYSLRDQYQYAKVDPDSCKYQVNKYDTTSQPNWVYAYGTVSLYDKYGSYISTKNFEIQVWRYDATNYECRIKDR